MAKPIAKLNVFEKLEQAKAIREKAEREAKEIEGEILKELKEEKKALLEKVAQLDVEIERISGKPVSAGQPSKRIDSEATILEIVEEKGPISCALIESDPKMVALYAGRDVSPQAIKLTKMVEAKKLVKTGERKRAVYSMPV